MSDTPRTDQRAFKAAFLPPEAIVTADFARELERELAALRADLIASQGYRAAFAEVAQRRGEMVDALTAERDALAAEVRTLKAAANPLAKRKVVQLIVLPQEGQNWNEAYALCDDGTMWRRHEPQGWSQTLNIPQPEQPEQEGQP